MSLNHTLPATAKGHVKLELFDQQGNVFLTKEKKNLVVQNANAIVANVLADPGKRTRVSKVDIGATSNSVSPEGFIFDLSIQAQELVSYTHTVTASNTQKQFALPQLANLAELKSVVVGSTALVIDKDVVVQDATVGTLTFEVAPTAAITISGLVHKNQYGEIINGSQVVKVAGVEFKRSNAASDVAKTYRFDAKRGIVAFETAKDQVRVEYDYLTPYTLGFMGLGGKPDGWADFKPVEFGLTDKLRNEMQNEFAGARMPIQFPAAVSKNAVEIQPSIIAKQIAIVDGVDSEKEITIDALPDSTPRLEYAVSNTYNTTGVATARLLNQVVEVKNVTQGTVIGHTVTQNDFTGIKVKFNTAEIAVGDKVTVKYLIQLDNAHLSYQLAQAPVIELVAVKFRRSLAPETALEYKIERNGLVPDQGDVWISDSATGQITFNTTITGPAPAPWSEAGQLQVEYRINSGTTVRFIAEFPQGVPGPVVASAEFTGTLPVNGTTFQLPNELAVDAVTGLVKNPNIFLNTSATPVPLSGFTVAADRRTITLTSYVSSSSATPIRVTYDYLNESVDIYQVAMFDAAVLDPSVAMMFNISGIGPITKDKNTGMRVTWAVTF